MGRKNRKKKKKNAKSPVQGPQQATKRVGGQEVTKPVGACGGPKQATKKDERKEVTEPIGASVGDVHSDSEESQNSSDSDHVLEDTFQGMHITQNINVNDGNVQIGDSNTMNVGSKNAEKFEDDPNDGPWHVVTPKKSKSFADATKVEQTINANTVVVNFNNTRPEKPIQKPMPSNVKQFLDSVKSNDDGHYILIIDQIEHSTLLEALAFVPWIAVYDFDPLSRDQGVLSYVEDKIIKRRAMHLCSWEDKCTISEACTCWIFPVGYSEIAKSRIDGVFKDWKKSVATAMLSQFQQIQRFCESYTKVTVVVLNPSQSQYTNHINHILNELERYLEPNFVLTTDTFPYTEDFKKLHSSLEMQTETLFVNQISVHDVCKVMSSLFVNEDESTATEFRLPTEDGLFNPEITIEYAQTLKVDLDVIYLENKTGIHYSLELQEIEKDRFFKGGTLPWSWWYNVGPGDADIERDIKSDIVSYIKKHHISNHRSGRVVLYHAPGSGGTTLAQRVVWELKDTIPCVQVKNGIGSSAQEVADKIQYICDKTRLPILVLIDGGEEQKVDRIEKNLRDSSAIIFYIKRYPYKITSKSNAKGEFWLKSCISKREAVSLGLKYIPYCEKEQKKHSVKSLVEDVEQDRYRSIFEFGLAVHSYEYKGLESYVRGFLKLHENKDGRLQCWQIALGYLSLACYYGHVSMPCHFFVKILKKDTEGVLTYEKLPAEMHELVLPDLNDGKKNTFRISHYDIAREILDQILLWPGVIPKGSSPFLKEETKRQVSKFAISFIQESKAVARLSSNNLLKIMTRIFISRDNKNIGENEIQTYDLPSKRKSLKFSPILEDVSNAPPYSERFDILKQLTLAFPEDGQLVAHLGRLYTHCRPDDEENAEDCFKKALELCRDPNQKEISHSMKLTLMHIYHMYANMFSARVSKYTGSFPGNKPYLPTEEGQFLSKAKELLNCVQTACHYFSKCREVTPQGWEMSYGFIGEILVRLRFCDYINRYSSKSYKNVLDYVSSSRNKQQGVWNKEEFELTDFLEECFYEIDQLFIDCFTIVDPSNIDSQFKQCQEWYSVLFNTKNPGHIVFNIEENPQSRRMQIALRKMQYSRKDVFGILELISKEEDIVFIANLYEKTISEFMAGNTELSKKEKRELDIDFREWLFAIRHHLYPRDIEIQTVLQYVQKWYECLKTPSSRFYLFVLKSILGFGEGKMCGKSAILLEALDIKEDMLRCSKYLAKPKYPKEWLGLHQNTIKALAPGKRFFGQFPGSESQKQTANPDCSSVEIMKGTILYPNNKPAGGFIGLDLGPTNYVQVKVFFVPARCDMRGNVYVGARVEFEVAFSMSHGYEAFNVNFLKKLTCNKCGNKNVEIRRCDKMAKCGRCKNTVYR